MKYSDWEHVTIRLDSGEEADAIAPIIISASRATDIPALYGAWFVERYKRGYVTWINPFSGKIMHVSFEKTQAVVFWTKNPRPMFSLLNELDNLIPNYIFHFTLNDYEAEGLEPGIPRLADRISTFWDLSRKIGAERVVWRFDPILVSSSLSVETVVHRIRRLAECLSGATQHLVISFIDITLYPAVRRNLNRAGAFSVREPTLREARYVGEALSDFPTRFGIRVRTCAEEIDLYESGIEHGGCISQETLCALVHKVGGTHRTDVLRNFFYYPKKDQGQRRLCRCIPSKDIGRYNTCTHGCLYCYANPWGDRVRYNKNTRDGRYPPLLGSPPEK